MAVVDVDKKIADLILQLEGMESITAEPSRAPWEAPAIDGLLQLRVEGEKKLQSLVKRSDPRTGWYWPAPSSVLVGLGGLDKLG
jgi:hypothetical protein